MPLTRIICPHCENAVEVSMTSVTRSRDCPVCGQTIMLQFTTQEKRQRRKALLTPAVTSDGEEEGVPGLAVTPRPIQGDLRQRMMLDPEVRQRVKVVKISVAVIGSIIVLVVLGSVFHWWAAIAGSMDQIVKQYNAARQGSGADDSGVEVTGGQATAGNNNSRVDVPNPIGVPNPVGVPPKEEVAPQDDAAVLKVVTSFLEAKNVDERLDLVLSRKLVEKKIREYYQIHPDGPFPYESVESLGADSAVDKALDFAVTLKNGERRRLVVRKSQAKGYLVDWPSFVIYSEMEWGEFVSTRTQKPVLFRTMAALSEVYRSDFSDSGKLVCLKITNPLDANSTPLYAYAQRSSSLGHTLEFVMRRAAGAAVPLILRLKYPESGGAPDQVWLDEFVGEGWVSRVW